MIPQTEPAFDKSEAVALSYYVLSGGWLTEHTHTKHFEDRISGVTGARFCHAVPNGTTALILALMAGGINSWDTVAMPSLTMVATANAARFIGCNIEFVDIDKHLCADIDELMEIDAQAIIYVALNGRCGDIERLREHCKDRDILLIEDACQALGSYHNHKGIGTFGDIGCYSLSPHKIISTGQGGLIVTDNADLSEKIRRLKDFGRLTGGEDVHATFGINAKFTDLQAVVGIEQVDKIYGRIKRKREIFGLYKSLLKDTEMVSFEDGNTPWFVDIYIDDATVVSERLKAIGVQTRPVYIPVHKQPCYNLDIELPKTESYSKRGLWLPSSIVLKDDDIEYICSKIKEFSGK